MSNKLNEFIIGCIGLICIAIVFVLFSYFIMAGITYVLSLCFGFSWNWGIPLGILTLAIFLRIIVKAVLT